MDKKGLTGATKIGALSAVLVFMIVLISYLLPVLAEHTSSVDLRPEWSPAGQNVDYTVTFCNDGSSTHAIGEVRIYRNISYTNFVCNDKPGWGKYFITEKQACQYVASNEAYYIQPGKCENFTFSATTPQEGCEWLWNFETRDETFPQQGSINYLSDTTSVDDLPPSITKTIEEPNDGNCPPGDNKVCWVTTSTQINVNVTDKGECGISGLDWCRITYTLDGSGPYEIIYKDLNGEKSWEHTFNFSEESIHILNITCKDIAGNIITDIEEFKVDDTPPETNKTYGNPYYADDISEWITSSTPITLTVEDKKEPCAVGVDKTWYIVIPVDDSYCESESKCNPICKSPYYNCCGNNNKAIEWCQKNCSKTYSNGTPEFYDCVENCLYYCCDGKYHPGECGNVSCDISCRNGCYDEMWKLYNGSPFYIEEESCHLIQYFSIDHLGNIEPMKHQCVFVDDTPPIGTKEIGEPSVYEVVGEEGGEGYFIVKIENPTDKDISGDVELYGQIKTDDGWKGVTDEVCVALSEDISYYFDPYWGGCSGPGGGCGPDFPGQTWEEWLAAHPDWMDWYVTGYEIIDSKYCGCGNLNMCDPDLTNNHNDPDIIPVLDWTDGKIIIAGQTIPANSKVWTVVKIKVLENGTYRFNIKIPEGLVMSQSGWDMHEFTWVRDNVTPITLTCEDPEPHPVNNEEVCFRVSFDDPRQPWLTDQYCNDVGGTMEGEWCCVKSPVTIIFEEDSLHDLEYYCRDALGNKNEIDLEYFRVDSQPPVIEKEMFGNYLGDCPPENPGDECYVADNGESGINITVHDNLTYPDCAVGIDYCNYGLWWNTTEQECYNAGYNIYDNITGRCLVESGSFGKEGKEIIFQEDSTHDLYIYCWDKLGNLAQDMETFLVDSTPPVTTKSYGTPEYHNDTHRWITSSTPISLTATDNKVGVDYIKYRVTLIGDDTCPENCDYTGDGDWVTVYSDSAEFTINQDSCHLIEYYSVDKLGNEEAIHKQCVMVDNTSPQGRVDTGDPKVDCESGEDCDHWIRDESRLPGTPIKLICWDKKPHPSGVNRIEYRYKIDGDWPQSNPNGDWLLYTGPIVFYEDTLHELEYRCIDNVGNIWNGPVKKYRVDSQPPVIEKEMFGNYLGDCPPENPGDVCYVADNNQSGVNITVHDNLTYPDCAVGDVSCEYILYWETNETTCSEKGYTWNSEKNMCIVESEDFTENKEIYFREDSTHHLYIYCEDALGNYIEDEETFLVDSTPPVTTKSYGTPEYHNDTHRWITSSTPISLTATDNKVGVDYIKYRVTLIGDDTCPENCDYTGDGDWVTVYSDSAEFTINQDSCHLIEYYSVDKLGNEEAIHNQCVMVDNTPPNITKEIGNPKIECEENESCDYWINQSTPIYLYCTDQGPHPVGADKIYYRYRVDGGNWSDWIEYPIDTIHFNEDSVHDLEYYCVDKLGNEGEHHIQTYRVDSTPPETTKSYGEPYFSENGVEWITSSTPIILTTEDGGDVCAIGTDKIYYRVELVSDESCWGPSAYCFPTHHPEDSGWTEYTAPFTINEESCHKIEYYSVDKLGNKELVKAQCVFVDNTPPTLWKEHSPEMIKDYDPELGTFYWMTKDMQIDLYCKDEGDHPVDHVKLWYRVWDDISQNWSEWTDPSDAEAHKTITFNEDSVHKIQYYCEDILGNSNGTHDNPYEQIYKVDSTPPETTKTYLGPYYVDENGIEYIDTASTIELTAEDGGEICAVGVNKTYYRVTRINDDYCYGVLDCNNATGEGNFTEYVNPFGIADESCHLIEYYSVDRLGNTEQVKNQCVFVDKTPPVIEKSYGEPYFSENGVEWITSSTPIYVEVYDPKPHPSGVKEVEYRVTLIDDSYCWNQTLCEEATGNGDWKEGGEEFNFTISEESCHLIEIKARDNVDKESYHKQCVFVDNSAPEPNKTIGKPRTKWDGKDAYYYDIANKCWNESSNSYIECWKITLSTPIVLRCIDSEPHPVNHGDICFKVEVDGNDRSAEYCEYYGGIYNKSEDGFCCINRTEMEFLFNEETEHNLQYYCVDILGNKGPMDEEKFKVEGRPFKIKLNKKWNLISVPFVLINDNITEVLKDVKDSIKSVWTYDPEHLICDQDWCVYTPDGNDLNDNLKHMIPGWGYWVLANKDDVLVIGGSSMSPAITPPERILHKGWNLIGYHGTDGLGGYYGPKGNGTYAYCALYTLRNEESIYPPTKWSSLSTYWEPDNPNQWKDYGICDKLDPGAGYWIYMDEEKGYTRQTACPEEMVRMICG